jgi:rhodanese-related sulfurtransferase
MNSKSNFVKIIASIFLILLFASLFAGCIGVTNDEGKNNDNDEPEPEPKDQIIEDISNEKSFQMINENKDNPNFIILDVRTSDEFAEGHIEDAINIDFYSETFSEELDKLNKTKKYLIYCRTANRSSVARDMMRDLEFSEVYNMLGGIVEWRENGYPVVT